MKQISMNKILFGLLFVFGMSLLPNVAKADIFYLSDGCHALDISTDKSSYGSGELITLNGDIYNYGCYLRNTVEIYIDGSTVYSGNPPLYSGGSGSFTAYTIANSSGYINIDTINANNYYNETFYLYYGTGPSSYTLYTQVLTGASSGSIVWTPWEFLDGCNTSCSTSRPTGTYETITAYPYSGYTFTGWGGACSAYGTGTCYLTMDSDKTVTASFASVPVTVTVTADSTSVPYNGTTTVRWSASSSALRCSSCTYNNGSGNQSCPGFSGATTGSFTTPGLTASTTFTINCDNN